MQRIYLDNGATTFPKPKSVPEAMSRFISESGVNINRGSYAPAYDTEETVYLTRLWLKEMVSKLGITSIFVTHDQDEAVEVADEILITNHGKIEQMGSPLEIYKSPKTPFVAQFVGRSSIVENYESLKGFEKIEHAQKAIVRPEFLELAKKGELKRYMSASEKGIVEDVIFSGSRLDVVVNINGIKVTAERSLEKDPVSVGEEVDIIIYRLYVFDEKETYLLENKEMQEGDVFYI